MKHTPPSWRSPSSGFVVGDGSSCQRRLSAAVQDNKIPAWMHYDTYARQLLDKWGV